MTDESRLDIVCHCIIEKLSVQVQIPHSLLFKVGNLKKEILEKNMERVYSRVAEAASRSGRKREDITVVAVTKTVSADIIRKLVELGVDNIGENRIQVAEEKFHLLSDLPQINWHLIGHLQRNKVKNALKVFSFFHSVDSLRLAKEIADKTLPDNKTPILLQVNVSGEESKHGFSEAQLEESLADILEEKSLDIQGLMTMAPLTDNEKICRECFQKTRELASKLRSQGLPGLKHLSMGMSQDYEVAIEEGATLVRVGSAFFRE